MYIREFRISVSTILWILFVILSNIYPTAEAMAMVKNRQINFLERKIVFQHHSNEEDLSMLLTEFASSCFMGAVISPQVTGKVSGDFYAENAGTFLQQISAAIGVQYYVNGPTFYFYKADEVEHKILHLKGMTPFEFEEIVLSMGIFNPQFEWTISEKQSVIGIYGPPQYLNIVSEIAQALTPDRQTTIKIFPLKYAWADEISANINGRPVIIPGVASILRQLATEEENVEKNNKIDKAKTAKMKGLLGLAPKNTDKEVLPTPMATTEDSRHKTTIIADTRLNSVVIRDFEDRMETYEKLIIGLDQPASMVEIQVAIVDVNTDRLQEIGINMNGGYGETKTFSTDLTAKNLVDGLNAITVFTNGPWYFLSKIKALEGSGDATVLSQPKILTINNTEAVLEQVNTFYVRVSGERDANLFDVTAGTRLHVTPHVIEENGGRKIKMALNIEDGGYNAEVAVDSVPTVSRSTIATQAVVGENQSLLIGGYRYEKEEKNVRGIPILSSLPVLGQLFRVNNDKSVKMERLFLITPKVIPVEIYENKDAPAIGEKNESLKVNELAFASEYFAPMHEA